MKLWKNGELKDSLSVNIYVKGATNYVST